MGDVLLLYFGNCCVYCVGKAFSKILLELAVGDSVEFFLFNLLVVTIQNTVIDKLIAPVGSVISAFCTI